MSDVRPDGRAGRRGPIAAIAAMRRAWGRISPFFGGARKQIAVLIALAVLAGLVEAGLLALIATIAAALSEGADTISVGLGPWAGEASRPLAFGIAAGLALARAGLHLWLAHLPARMSAQVLARLRSQLFGSFTGSSWSVKADEREGRFQTLMNVAVRESAQAVINVAAGITAAVMFTTMVVAAFLQSLVGAASLVVASMVLFIALRPLSRRLRRQAQVLSREVVEFTEAVQEIVASAEEVEAFGATDSYRSGFHRRVEEVRRPHERTRFLAAAVPGLYQSAALLMLVLALAAISVSGTARLAALAAVVLLLIRAFTYAQQMQAALASIDERAPFMEQVVDALELYRTHPYQDGTDDLGAITTLGMDRVSFAYRPGRDVLRDVTFEVSRGEAIGIVGPSGAGKSSIVQLLLRLREPTAGSVRVDGRDVRRVRREPWREQVAYLPQHSQLIWGTVRDNIRFHREWLDDGDIVAAARLAHVHDEIVSWPQGYDTVVGQRASAVSGGQRQRLCLARALAGRPRVLVLDEPTSALDVRSEELVQASLSAAKPDMILVLVAHRLSTLSLCDRIMVVVDGRISAIGSRADLLEQSDFFRQVNEITQRAQDRD